MKLSARRFATLRRVCDSLLIALIVIVLFGVVLGRLVPLTGRTTLIIGGGSMEPAISMGTAVIVDPVAPTAIQVGDVVSLRTGTNLQAIFTHRVTRVVERDGVPWVETRGDANPTPDPSITSTEHVIGRVSATIPYAGFLLALLSVPSGVLFVVFLAGVLLTLTWLLESFEIDLAVRDARLAPQPATPRAVRARRLRHARHVTGGAAGPGD
jgi:signal peptidase